jgi:hypothetical protein
VYLTKQNAIFSCAKLVLGNFVNTLAKASACEAVKKHFWVSDLFHAIIVWAQHSLRAIV